VLEVASGNLPVLVRGCHAADRLHFGFILAAREPGYAFGHPVVPGGVRVLAEGHEVDYRTAPELALSAFQVTREEVERAAVAHLGRLLPIPRTGWLNFLPTEAGPLLAHRIRSTLAVASQTPAGLSSSVARVLHEQLLGAFIDVLAAGFGLSARGEQHKSLPRRVLMQRARDYLSANLDQPFILRALSEAACCSERVLQYAFREVYGVGPQGWFQAMKLNEANRELRAYGPGEVRVTDVALRWGFTHFGRFSVEYRRMFGERPSDTLKRVSRSGKRNEKTTIEAYRAIGQC
jgi:AraC-like DNA-binding protein